MLTWRDLNKDIVRDIDFNDIEEGIIEFKGAYKQHFVVVEGKVFMEIVEGGIDLKFVYNPKTWTVARLRQVIPKELSYGADDAMQDMITVYATIMAMIKENHGVIKTSKDEYMIFM
jgi:hypothetical protein